MEQNPSGNYINRGTIYINDPSTCFICKKNDLHIDATYCTACGFPQQGTDAERKSFYVDHIKKKNEFDEALKGVKASKNILFIASGLCLLSGFILSVIDSADAEINIIAGFVMALIFLGLGFWAQKNPLAASVTGLIVYVTALIIGIVVTVSEGGRRPFGIMDIVIIITLIRGVRGAIKAENLRKEKGWD